MMLVTGFMAKAQDVPEFSTDASPVYYFMKFTNGNWCVKSQLNSSNPLPTFSTSSNKTYFQIQFKNGQGCIADQSSSASATVKNLKTATKSSSNTQLWAFVGDNTKGFKMVSKSGNWVGFANDRFNTSSDESKAVTLIFKSYGETFDLCRKDNQNKGMNQWGGTSIGAELGEWNGNDNGNKLNVLGVTPPEMGLVMTAAKAYNDEERWMFIGTQKSFKAKNAAGQWLGYNGTAFTANVSETNAKTMKMTKNSAGSAWLLERTSGSTGQMNMHGGSGEGKEIHEWNSTTDPGNFIVFDPAFPTLPEFSTEGNDVWYFLQFKSSGNCIEAKGNGINCVQSARRRMPAQLWKFVGDKNGFTLVNKAGGNAYFNGTAGTGKLQVSTSKSTEFVLTETTNSTHAPAWEISLKSNGGSKPGLNQTGGTAIGNAISTWTTGDANNPFTFVLEEDVPYTDFIIEGATSFVPENKLTLWYNQPATTTGVSNIWMEYSLPIGNGQLGGSLFGGIYKDQILVNEKTLWTGTNQISGNYTCYGDGVQYGAYQYFGNLYAEALDEDFNLIPGEPAITNYVRSLDLTNGIGSVRFTSPDGQTNYTREYFVSNPDEAIVAVYKADKSGKINLRFYMESGKPGIDVPVTYTADGGKFKGKLNTVSYACEFKIVATGGTVTKTENGIEVRGADEAKVVLCAQTDYDINSATYVSGTSALPSKVSNAVAAAAAKSYAELRETHVADFTKFMGRVNFDLGGVNTIPTDQLVDQYATIDNKTPKALMLEELYFAYGRYLSISSSRGIDVPNNLQGIWNNNSTPPWHADIHTNINIQMNYWPCLIGNMYEMNEKLVNFIWQEATQHNEWKTWATTAPVNNKKGWTIFTESNIFGGGSVFQRNYVIANAWYCVHMWQHYLFTLDKVYLKEKALPTMWSCCEFWMDRLVKGSDGKWECPDEYSPEHGPGKENATAHSQQLVADLFENTLKAIEILGSEAGISESNVNALKAKFEDLDRGLAIETYTGEWGESRLAKNSPIMREWKYSNYNCAGADRNHRHMSHLMCLYPLMQIDNSKTELFNAAINTMKLRGDASTGWSMGWKINLWARALNGERSHAVLHTALRHSTSYGTNQAAGGIYYNLYDSHSPFQIDGNFGACSGIMECIMQSHTGVITLLPALPKEWENGTMTGLKAIGNYTVDQEWENKAVTKAAVTAAFDGECKIRCADMTKKYIYLNGTVIANPNISDDILTINVKAGDKIVISKDEISTAIENVSEDSQILTNNSEIYDLSGRALTKNAKGVVIAKGKKVVQ